MDVVSYILSKNAVKHVEADVEEVKEEVAEIEEELDKKVNKDELGSSAYLDAPVMGDATDNEVVLGCDSRLSDARTPVAHTHLMNEISDLPALGTVVTYDIPVMGDALPNEVVMGDDSRLTDSRDPNPHTHTVSDISDFPSLGTAAEKDWSNTYDPTSEDLVTGKVIGDALETLPHPMIFKGSLGEGGTISQLPAAVPANEGFTYKVITDGTYAGCVAHVGDSFTSDGSVWVHFPSGDEPGGTVMSVKIQGSGAIAVDDESAITTSGVRTISHNDSGVSAGTYTSVTVDEKGHVTAGSNPDISYNDLTDKPTLGTAAALDVPASGNASSSQVVKGDDSRLTDARTPVSHTHTLSEVTDAGTAAALNVASSGDASTSEVVKGDDSRLTDSRNAADVYAWAKEENKPSYTKSEIGLGNVDNTSDADKPISTATQTALDNKVDKVDGKGLSTNDYTTTEKNKLVGIESGAEVNIQADWDEDDNTSDAFINNKPTSMPASDVYSWAKEESKPTYTASEVGLGNVDNTADLDKPISTATQSALDDKVDKISGKGLSTNDYTTDEKNKLSGIAAGAEVNIQSDWNQSSSSADDYIKNKPENLVQDANYVHTDNNYTTTEKDKLSGIASGAEVNVQSDWSVTDNTSDAFIKNKPNIPAAQVNADWNASSGVAEILNKPTLGTAAALNVASTGDASSAEVVKGNDSRLTDSRTPKSHTHTKSEITDFPTLGTAAAKDVPASGNASASQVVMGNDTRLTDSRNAKDVYSWAKASTKPTYTASEVGAIAATAKGANNGVAELDSAGKVPSSQLPSFVDDVLEYDSLSSFPTTGETGKIYVAKDTNKTYRWSGTAYVEISPSLALGETSSTAYRGDRGKVAYDHSQSTHARTDATAVAASSTNGNIKINGTETTVYTHPGSGTNPHGTTKTDVGLGNVGNFKAVSTVANQGLTDTEKSNARANIGAGTSNLTIGTTSSTAAAGNHSHSAATTAANGFMTTAQVTKLNGIEAGAQVNTVTSVAGKTGAVTLSASDVGALASTTKYAGASTAGGAATSAAKLTNTSKIGDTNKPVYFSADGVPVAISYTIEKSVPSNAVFTDNDTKNTAGSTDTSSKIFLIGATSQAANPQTYSHDTAYVGTDGCLYSGGSKVLTSHQDISGKVNKTGDTMSGNLTFNSSAGIQYAGTKATNLMIKFLDNTSDAYGNGIAIGGGGATIIGGGESASTVAANINAGEEAMYISNDNGNIIFVPNIDSGWANRKTSYFDADGDLHVNRYLFANYLNQSSGAETPNSSSYIMYANSDGYLRKSSIVNIETLLYPYEAKLRWGGQNITGGYGPIDAALMDELGANRFQFIKASAITVEYSRDGGSTWTDYGASDAAKMQIFAQGGSLGIGKNDSSNKATSNPGKYMLRITIDTGTAGIYTVLNKIVVYCSTAGSANCYCKIQKALQSTPTTFVDHTDNVSISGWSGYNVININGLTTYGNTAASQYGRVRFIFGDGAGGSTSYNGLQILQIKGFGGVGWNTPSTMAKTGHLYSYDQDQNVTFPAKTTIIGETIIQKEGLWVQGGSAAGGNYYRLTTVNGMPEGMGYNQGKRGTRLYSNGIAFLDPYNGNNNNDSAWIRHIEETANNGTLEIAVGDDAANEVVAVRRYNTSNNVANEILLFDTNGNTSFPGTVTATNFRGSIANATGLTKSQVTTALGYTPPTSDTNDKVSQTATSNNVAYEVLFSGTADNTTRTEGARKTDTLRFNPSIGALMEGFQTYATGNYSHAEGGNTTASATVAHAEGGYTYVSGKYSHGEGCKTSVGADSWYSHAEGYGTSTYANSSHTEGYKTVTYDNYAHAEGDRTTANYPSSHAEGSLTCANGNHSHTEGVGTYAYHYAHAEGYYNKAIGNASHAEGGNTTAKGNYSHAAGYYTSAAGDYQTVIGKYNYPNTTDAFQIGCGGNASNRNNLFGVKWDGTMYLLGACAGLKYNVANKAIDFVFFV